MSSQYAHSWTVLTNAEEKWKGSPMKKKTQRPINGRKTHIVTSKMTVHCKAPTHEASYDDETQRPQLNRYVLRAKSKRLRSLHRSIPSQTPPVFEFIAKKPAIRSYADQSVSPPLERRITRQKRKGRCARESGKDVTLTSLVL
jgi:hypothetical protein